MELDELEELKEPEELDDCDWDELLEDCDELPVPELPHATSIMATPDNNTKLRGPIKSEPPVIVRTQHLKRDSRNSIESVTYVGVQRQRCDCCRAPRLGSNRDVYLPGS